MLILMQYIITELNELNKVNKLKVSTQKLSSLNVKEWHPTPNLQLGCNVIVNAIVK